MSLPVKKPSAFLVYGALILSLTIWGGTSVVSKVTVETFPVYSTLFLRFCVASLILIPFYLHDGHRAQVKRTPIKHIHWLILLSFVGISLQMGFFFIGITQASVMDANIISALVPLLIAVASWILLKERFRLSALTGLVLATIGVTYALTYNSASTHHSYLGNLAIFGSVLSSVAYAIGSKRIGHHFCPLAITTTSFLVGLVTFLPLAAWEYITQPQLFANFSTTTLWGIAYLGVISSVLAYWFYQWSLDHVSATTVGIFSFVQPLSGMILARIFLGEALGWGYVLGGTLTLLGITLALGHPSLKPHYIKWRPHLRRRRLADKKLGLSPNVSHSITNEV